MQSRGWFRCLPSTATRRNGGLLVRAEAEKNKVSHDDYKYTAIEFVQARQMGLKANTILGTKWVDGTV